MRILLMYEPHAAHFERLRRAAPAADFFVAHSEDEARSLMSDADAVLGNRWFYQTVGAAKRLRWMQSNSTGVDLILENVPDVSFTLTSASGVYDEEVATHALAMALALVRGLHRFRDAQRELRWARQPLRLMSDLTALILGWGGIGQSIARMLQPFGTAVRPGRRESWRELLDVDLLFIALPLTRDTRHIVGASELQALEPGAFVINTGRGATLDTDALLLADHLGGAALDVFEEEPLPSGHPLWTRENVIITPHVAHSPETAPFRWEAVFEENLRRFAADEPLLHAVDPARGY
jgi:phosphoglycerate dehydrogenase-like enzyme